jgi:hypothetical protein
MVKYVQHVKKITYSEKVYALSMVLTVVLEILVLKSVLFVNMAFNLSEEHAKVVFLQILGILADKTQPDQPKNENYIIHNIIIIH